MITSSINAHDSLPESLVQSIREAFQNDSELILEEIETMGGITPELRERLITAFEQKIPKLKAQNNEQRANLKVLRDEPQPLSSEELDERRGIVEEAMEEQNGIMATLRSRINQIFQYFHKSQEAEARRHDEEDIKRWRNVLGQETKGEE